MKVYKNLFEVLEGNIEPYYDINIITDRIFEVTESQFDLYQDLYVYCGGEEVNDDCFYSHDGILFYRLEVKQEVPVYVPNTLDIKATYNDKTYRCTLTEKRLEPFVSRKDVLINLSLFFNNYLQDIKNSKEMNNNMHTKTEEEIMDTKYLRAQLSSLLDTVNIDLDTQTRSLSIAKTKIEEARMWLGKHLAELGNETPYVIGNDVSTPMMEPTADIEPIALKEYEEVDTWVDEDGYPEKAEEVDIREYEEVDIKDIPKNAEIERAIATEMFKLFLKMKP